MNIFRTFWKNFCTGLFIAITPMLMAQQVVTGRITDAADGSPVPGASVFVANTTIGTASDTEGNYSFTVPGQGSFEVVISHVSYQTISRKIDIPRNAHRYDVALEVVELEEVTIMAAKTYKNSDVNLFWNKILGERPSRNGMEVLNPEKVYFYLNKENNILKASCREPLEIINHRTGYRIRYVLQSFEHDYQTGETTFYGKPHFEEIAPQNNRQKNNWEKKRQEVYAVSLNHFMRALYRGQIHEEGFLVIDINLLENVDAMSSGNIDVGLISQETLQQEQRQLDQEIQELLNQAQKGDQLAQQRYAEAREERYRAIRKYQQTQTENSSSDISDYRRIIEESPAVLLENISDQAISMLTNKDTPAGYRNIFRVNIEDPLFLVCLSKPVAELREKKVPFPVMLGLSPQQFTIYPDGSYTGLLKMQEHRGNLMSLSGLSAALPVEYAETIPDNAYNLTVAHVDIPEQTIDANMTAQLEAWPQEKIHLHTDRDFYVPGEKIWFRAYVADAVTHRQYAVQSRYVYVEMISPVDTLINRVMIAQTDGMFYGYLPITKNIPEGNYTLCAYTRHMENMGDDYFFKKNIRIEALTVNNAENGGNRGTGEQKNRINSPLSEELEGASYDVSFFPEGGNLPEGVVSKIAFKALNRTGQPEPVSGYLVDENGVAVTPEQTIRTGHAGMGVFNYLPETGKQYRLVCRNEAGLEKRFDLPQPDPRARSLAVSVQSNGIRIGVQKSVNIPDISCYLLMHSRGDILYFSEWDNRQEFVMLNPEDLPAGVIQVVLFDEQMNPLSERLIFSKNDASAEVEIRTDQEEYGIREKITATITPSLSGNVVEGFLSPSLRGRVGEGLSHFSVAVTDDRDIAVDETTTILSSLLLSSELKGYIENPAYYFRDDIAMDLLMMTHGWRRYNIPEVVRGHIETPQIPFQQFQEISGRVKTMVLNRPVPDSEIFIMMKSEGEDEDGSFGIMSTDENGLFAVSQLAFPDSTTFFIQALNRKGRDNVRLNVEPLSFPQSVYALQTPLSRLQITDTETKDDPDINAFMEKAEQRAKFEEDIWTLYLDEVEVTAPIIKKKEPRDDFYLNASADYTITREVMETYKFPSIVNYLQMIPRTRVTYDYNGQMNVDFLKVVSGEIVPPIIVVDGVTYDYEDGIEILNSFTVDDIESIDAIQGIGATILGTRGAGGALSITSRRWGGTDILNPKFNNVVYNPVGYQKPVEFYAPKYETREARQTTIPDYRTTIFWKPDVVVSDEGEASFDFYTSDFPATYSVVIEGITDDGKPVRQVKKIRIR